MNIILFRGRPGVGKTTTALALAKQAAYPVLSKDSIYDVASAHIEAHAARNKLAYDCLYSILEANRHCKSNFILDYPFQTAHDFSLLQDWCNTRAVLLHSILVTCSSEEAWAGRFSRRAQNPAPNQLITSFEELKSHYGSLAIAPEPGELVIDTVQELPLVLEQLRSFLKQRLPSTY